MVEIGALSASAVGVVMKPIIADIYASVKNYLTPDISHEAHKALSATELGKQVYRIINVKTLWNVEKEVSLFEFYYPSRVKLPGQKVAQKITSVTQLKEGNRFVLQGTAGQGKSILLRYLYGQLAFESGKSRTIPLFVELRRLASDVRLADLIAGELRRLGIRCTHAHIPAYLSTGKIVLLLDAFDEIDADLISRTVDELEEIATVNEDLFILVTSRPNSAIQQTSFFRVAQLDPLKPADHLPFLEKICADKSQASEIHTAIVSTKGSELEALLTTPLLLTLLVLLYRAQSTFPSTLVRFYEQLFEVMFFKHDQTKPGLRRNRFTNLDEIQLKQLFDAFSFHARVRELQIFSTTSFDETLREAIGDVGFSVSPAGFRKELVKTACLLIEEGLEFSFIHKSVAEFYAASFIQRSGNEFAIAFYEEIRDKALHVQWAGELNFLEHLDPYRCSKYYLQPELIVALEFLGVGSDGKPIDNTKFLTELSTLGIRFEKRQDKWGFAKIIGFNFMPNRFFSDIFIAVINPIFSLSGPNGSFLNPDKLLESCIPPQNVEYVASVADLSSWFSVNLEDKIEKSFSSLKIRLLNQKRLCDDLILREESKKRLLPMLKKKLPF